MSRFCTILLGLAFWGCGQLVQAQVQPVESPVSASINKQQRSYALLRYGFPIYLGAAFLVRGSVEPDAGASFRFGSVLQVWPTRIFGFSTGLGLNLINLNSKFINLNAVLNGNIALPGLNASGRLLFLNLPIGFTIRTDALKKYRFYFATHYDNQFVLSSTFIFNYYNNEPGFVDNTKDFHTDNKFYFGAIRFNLGADIQVSPKVSLVVGPYVAVENMVRPDVVKGIEYTFDNGLFIMAAGLNFGVMLDCKPRVR